VGRELVLALAPTSDLDEARGRLAATAEAVRLIRAQPATALGGVRDIRVHIARSSRQGALSGEEVAEVGGTLRAARALRGTLADLPLESYPRLQALAEELPVPGHLIARIEETVDEEGQVRDEASPELRRLRQEVRAAQQRLQQRLRTLVAEFGSALQEPIVTMRSDRYVVPVKADSRGQVRGIVHDQSASGATIYVEPMVVVELNNQLTGLIARERQEVERILRQLSMEIGEEGPAIRLVVETLAEVDLRLACARYAERIRATEPQLNGEGRIDLRQARHPLLTGHVVPIDFRLGQEFFMVVVTGPNTGGKTVALKTVGLLTLMAQSGLHIPVEGGAEIAVFDEVFADIGDEQSIEQSLSTFSSHMTRIIEVLRVIETRRRTLGGPPPVLVLFDELGAGTDPSEGSALAQSILTWLLDRQIPTVATTHYSELKAFAHEQRGVVNASVAFDLETLSPTYELEIGVPGRSNALAIAERLGLDTRIIRGARRHLGTEGVRMEGLLQGLEEERDAAAQERRQLDAERRAASGQRDALQAERERLEADRARILAETRANADLELESVMAELAEIRASARQGTPDRGRADELRRRTRRAGDRISPSGRVTPRAPRLAEQVESLDGPLKVGDSVYVRNLDQVGELLQLWAGGAEAEVGLGPLRLRVHRQDLERVRRRGGEAPTQSEPAISVVRPPGARHSVSMQLDMRGQRVEDALEELESYLNDAAMSGLSSVRIVHGKGTGALRSAVRERLAHHPLVESSEPASTKDGGEGVTIARLSA
ncbi:MAG TPA: endonuclease MutS2, partial [Candidatus Dormibacteraeota bacterium]|nr:endonuclease MutS2 [Candidatus Dormibacteraeota bacterium]